MQDRDIDKDGRPDGGAVFDLASRPTQDHHQSLKLWLRMLSCTVRIENEIRSRLRTTFGITLPKVVRSWNAIRMACANESDEK